MSNDLIVNIQQVWKRYGLPYSFFIREKWHNLIGKPLSEDELGPWALRDISLAIRKGESLGIIGRNGAGKSTLLKLLAKVTPPSRGSICISGRLFPMIELNAGIHPDLTGRENAFLLGAIFGIPKKDTRARMPLIQDFCELGEWFDRPVRMYSSGMLARLGFSVAVHADCDILLVDEVLATGDVAFQEKCLNRISELIKQNGTTLIFVSHSASEIERLCSRGILLENGRMIYNGDTHQLIKIYAQPEQCGIDSV